MAFVRHGVGARFGVVLIGCAVFAYCALRGHAPSEVASSLTIERMQLDDEQHITYSLPPCVRYESTHENLPAVQPGVGVRLVNNCGSALKLEVVSKSCGCTRINGLPEELPAGAAALIMLEIDVRRRESASLEAVVRATAERKHCFVRLRRQFRFVRAIEVSPVVVSLDLAAGRHHGTFSVKFLTTSRRLAEQAELRLENGPKKTTVRLERSRSRAADGTFEVLWQATASGQAPDGSIIKNPPMSFVMITAGKNETWSAPMQFRWRSTTDTAPDSSEARVNTELPTVADSTL